VEPTTVTLLVGQIQFRVRASIPETLESSVERIPQPVNRVAPCEAAYTSIHHWRRSAGHKIYFSALETIVHECTCREIVAALLGCWPEPVLAVSKRIAVTKPALDRYLAGTESLNSDAQRHLMEVLGLERDDSRVNDDGSQPVTSTAHYVLIAGNAKERVLVVYNFLMRCGHMETSVELLPASHAPGHRWRYLLMIRYAEVPSLICFPRIGKAASLLESGQLTNFRGQYFVEPLFYAAVDFLRASVEQRPGRVLRAMHEFYKRWDSEVLNIATTVAHTDES